MSVVGRTPGSWCLQGNLWSLSKQAHLPGKTEVREVLIFQGYIPVVTLTCHSSVKHEEEQS